jgi:hypothetical protein
VWLNLRLILTPSILVIFIVLMFNPIFWSCAKGKTCAQNAYCSTGLHANPSRLKHAAAIILALTELFDGEPGNVRCLESDFIYGMRNVGLLRLSSISTLVKIQCLLPFLKQIGRMIQITLLFRIFWRACWIRVCSFVIMRCMGSRYICGGLRIYQCNWYCNLWLCINLCHVCGDSCILEGHTQL